jgi:site-specific recombinase XerD
LTEAQRAPVASQSVNFELFALDESLAAWQYAPEKTFLEWLARRRVVSVRQYRDSSRETYAAMFATWVRYLQERDMSVLEATYRDAHAFFSDPERRLEPGSRRRYLQLLSKVYIDLREMGWNRPNPLVPELKKERVLDVALPDGLDEPAQTRLVEMLRTAPGWKGARDRGMAALLLGAGLRTNELVNLPLEDFPQGRVHDYRIRVQPHTVHREHVTLVLPDGPWRAWVHEWSAERVRRQIPGTLACPATLGGTGYSPSGLFRRISGWFDAAGVVASRQGAGILRNTFARSALACGRYSTEEVQEFLGHEDSRITLRHSVRVDPLSPDALWGAT